MKPEVLKDLCEFVNRRSGLSYNRDSRSLLERRIAPRLRELSLPNFGEYVQRLKKDLDELDWLFETLTTKETYFFRQEYQFKAFQEEVLPRIVEAAGSPGRLTIWSAGCSSGEEAYTIAMLLSQNPLLMSWKVRVIGTDLCPSNIATATRGVYRSSSSFRAMEDGDLKKYFSKVDDGWRVKHMLRKMVHFSVGNLINPVHVRSVGRVDVIFCRNVLIYFDDTSRHMATSLFLERLLPGGYLLLGHSESLLNAGTNFEPVHLEGDLVYRRPPLSGSQSRIKVDS